MALLRDGHRAPREILSEKRDLGRKQKELGSDKAAFRPRNESPPELHPWNVNFLNNSTSGRVCALTPPPITAYAITSPRRGANPNSNQTLTELFSFFLFRPRNYYKLSLTLSDT